MASVKFLTVPSSIIVQLDRQPFQLSSDVEESVEKHWMHVKRLGKTFTRGMVFTVSSIDSSLSTATVYVKPTDYAHYLATVDRTIDRQLCRVIYSAGAVVTSDRRIVIGRMAEWTRWAGRWQFSAGGLSQDDLDGDRFQMELSLRRELHEELGLGPSDIKHASPRWLKTGGPYNFLALIYLVWLHHDQQSVADHYRRFVTSIEGQGGCPEFSEVAFIPLSPDKVEQWLTSHSHDPMVDYLPDALRYLSDIGR